MVITVVGLGKIGLPLAVQFAEPGHEVARRRRQRRRRCDRSTRASSRSPARPTSPSSSPRSSPPGALTRHHRHRRRGRAAATRSSWSCRCSSTTRRAPDFGWMDAATDDIAARAHARHARVATRPPCPVGTTRTRWKPLLEEGSGLVEGGDFHLVFSPERVLTGRVFADLRKYPKLVGGLSAAGADAGRRVLRGGAGVRRAPRPRARQRRLGPRLGRGGRDGQARRDDLPRREHRPGEPVRALRRASTASTSTRSSRPATPSPTATSTGPASPSAGTASRSIRGCTCGTTPTRPSSGPPARPTPRCRPTPSASPSGRPAATSPGTQVAVLGAAYRGGVKETAFSGVFATVEALRAAGAEVVVHDPLYTDDELAAVRLRRRTPRRRGRRGGRAGRPRRVPRAVGRATCRA